ncbi:MAG: hypothetical protein M1840_002085 [Geoglossum simile]|nr:MAG: hypothetical protein M1840_002085 [Geoglossum simile]
MATLRAVQVAARRVLDLRRPRHVHVEGSKARLTAAVDRLARRQARYNRDVLVEQRVAAALEENKNPAAMLAPLIHDLTTEVRYLAALSHYFGGAPPASPPPSPAREGLVLSESEEEEDEE